MPAIVNVAASLLFGAAFALVARESAALRRSALSWPFFFAVTFQALVVAPMAAYLFRFHPQWSMLYWFDPQIFPTIEGWVGWLSGVAVLCNVAAAIIGFTVARIGILAGSQVIWAAPLALGAGAILSIAIAYGDRVAFLGDYDAFWQGAAVLVFKRLPGWIGLGVYLAGFLFVLWAYSRFRDHDPTLI
jgi:hypothetical protein